MRGARRLISISAGFALLLTSSAGAQGPMAPVTSELAPGVFLVTMPDRGAADANVLLVINEADVLVVDTGILPSSAEMAMAELRKRTDKPVRYIVNTHWHSDHHYGTATWLRAYPDAEVIQHSVTRRDIIERDAPALKQNLAAAYPQVIAGIRKALDSGVTSQGVTVTDAMRAGFTKQLALYEAFQQEMGASRVVPATLTVSDSLVLHRGSRTVIIKYLGLGNTAGDLVVLLPAERIIATGDLLVHPIPFAFFSHLDAWPATLRKLMTIDATTIVPGHGPVFRDWSYAEGVIGLLESTMRQVARAVASGAPDLEAVRRAVDLSTERRGFATTEAAIQRFDAVFTTPAVEAAYRTLRPAPAK
ncbi:MAG: MBL fold metallo-hydrolase [Gemmatimonadales bacterium]